MSKTEFDAYRDTYEATVEESLRFSGLTHNFFQRSKARMIRDILARYLEDHSPPALLDVGCGIGALHPLISPMFRSVDGVDVSADSLARARDDNPDQTYKHYDGHRLPYENDSFDMSLAICVMHHVSPDQWQAFMAEMTRVVAPGGIVCLIEHNPINPATRLSVARCPFDVDAVLLGAGKMRRFMRSAGLGSVSTRHFVFFPFSGPVFHRLERSLHWLPLGAQYAAIGRVS